MNRNQSPIALGLDFGTESVRAILVDCTGQPCGNGTHSYRHGQIIDRLPGTEQQLPPHYALQSPDDWLESARLAVQAALNEQPVDPTRIVGIGVDFTSCTMLPTLADGTPLCRLAELAQQPLAWPKLWKHHGAIKQTERMNAIATEQRQPFLNRYGGVIGLEWFFPKMLETIELAPQVAEAAEVWLEAGDWFVWQLTGGSAADMARSTCQAGYKALWSAEAGYATAQYLASVHPLLAEAAERRMPGRLLSPGQRAGSLCKQMASAMGLPAGIAVSAAIIDAHAAVPGVGVADPDVLVMVLGTSSCHMLNSTANRNVPGIAGIVQGGILPELYGYETGQAAVGDAFAWLIKLLQQPDFADISRQAQALPPGADGVLCLDWMNGCRTPLMDGALKGAFAGLTLATTPAHLYRALLEASAYGLRWIVELLRDGGVPVKRFVATGGLPHHNPELIQIYCDVLGADIEIHPSQHACAVGAAVLGMFAAGHQASGFSNLSAAAQAMASTPSGQRKIVSANPSASVAYQQHYARYRRLADAVRQLNF
ncbi:MAG: ribulokinase [Pirellulaceae bacterium]|nr:ribulokinase [Pirellulaceae bacterium]